MESDNKNEVADQKQNPETTPKAEKDGSQETAITEQDVELSTFPISIKTCTEKKNLIQLQVSPMDNIQDIKQYLFESIDTCHITNYHLFINGNKLNDYARFAKFQRSNLNQCWRW